MNTRWLMRSSAGFMGVLGVAAIFAPREIAAAAGIGPGAAGTLVLQVTGALYFGFALLNWMAQGNLIGGIYSKPVAMGNFAHFLVVALALAKAVATGEHSIAVVVGAVGYVAFALLFARVAFGDPLPATATTGS